MRLYFNLKKIISNTIKIILADFELFKKAKKKQFLHTD